VVSPAVYEAGINSEHGRTAVDGERLECDQAVVEEEKNLMRLPVKRAVALAGAITLSAVGFVAAAATATASDEGSSNTGFTTSVFAAGSTTLSKPDDITSMGGSIFVSWQNGVGPKGEPAGNGNLFSTIARYSSNGQLLNSWQLKGRCDGMTADPQHERIIATVNEDANTSLYVIKPDADAGEQLTHYTYSPNPPVHQGGTDAPHIYKGQIFISASAPGDVTAPALYRATLSGTTATLAPVFYDNSTAIVANTNDPAHGTSVTLALSDPDSNNVVPRSSSRFGGDFVLDSQGDGQQVYAHKLGTSGQKLFLLNLSGAGNSTAVDDTVWATSSEGTLYATDGNTTVYAIRGHFDVGTAFSSVSPANANTPPITPVPNWLATLNLNTGLLSPVASVTIHPKGLLFVAGGDEGEGD